MWQSEMWFKTEEIWLKAQSSIAIQKALGALEGLLIMGAILGGMQCYQLSIYAASLPPITDSSMSFSSSIFDGATPY